MNTKHDTDTSVQKTDVAAREESILEFWREHDIFQKSLETPAGGEPVGDFVFYDGPPFATGLPHYGHILAGTIKDAVPRFWTMNGYRVRRQWGWDCHGLPLENLIEKELGLATKKDIEEFGIQNFNEKARGAVMRYADEWRRIIPRMGRFADMENDYKTMDPSYTESVWWVFKTLHEKGLVYEGFKGMHLCPRCGTTLSNFEVNQGYKDIKDIAVMVKLPLLDEQGEPTDTSLLVWTTTPWTLPGNLAAAVHKEYDYVKVQITEFERQEYKEKQKQVDFVILAKERYQDVFGLDSFEPFVTGHPGPDSNSVEYKIVKQFKGTDLVGKKYESPFPYLKDQDMNGKENAWQIYHADYVELGEEGTGAVHLAPAYGEEDMELAKEKGVPIFHHVDEAGRFKDFIGDGLAGDLVKPKDDDDAGVDHKDADIKVLKLLQENGAFFKKENITHSYPHCWRCDTPLLNYATTSWFVEVTKIRDELVSENDKVHWVPEHVGKNRFGKWLEGARDWAVSRQRYWGAPLPIWCNPESGEYKVIGSLQELQEYVPKSGNQYFVMRHGQSESNVAHVISARKENQDGVTEKGREQVEAALSNIPEDVDLIIHSGFQRTRETAEQIAAARPNAEVLEDDRIRELDIAEKFEGQTWPDYDGQFPTFADRYRMHIDGVENRLDVQIRVGEFLFDLERTHHGKKILIVGHGAAMFAAVSASQGYSVEESKAYRDTHPHPYFENAEVRELPFTLYPHNDHYELDYHRPYIDQVDLYEDDTKLERVEDVFDCWFESGSMPYGQHHYPFEKTEQFEQELFPANFIAEGLDQTRGWFYSLIVLGTALFGKSPYENVIVNGTVLAEDGRKMSKSLQNYPDPMDIADTLGADAMRFYLLSSPVIRAEDFNFAEKEVQELQRKNIGRLHNVLAMYETYADKEVEPSAESEHVLDRWIIARLNELVAESTAGYKNYELDRATRPITDFIDDLSVWYLRRSRDRLKGEDEADKERALATLRSTLRTLALVMAPAMPFYAEYLWGRVKTEEDAESVHLAKWPERAKVDATILKDMETARFVVTGALQERAANGIKVRQPLSLLRVTWDLEEPNATDVSQIIADEVNVKRVEYQKQLTVAFQLDVNITPELQAEGDARELMRQVQDMRKKAGLAPQDRITLTIQTSDGGEAVVTAHEDDIKRTVGAETITFGDADGSEVTAGEHSFTIELARQ